MQFLLVILWACALILLGGAHIDASAESHGHHGQAEAEMFRQMAEEFTSKNRLVHLRVDPPTEWRLGATGELVDCVLVDFSGISTIGMVDSAFYTHPASKGCIAIAYRPILGRSEFDGRPKEFVQRFLQWQLNAFSTRGINVLRGELAPSVVKIGDKTLSVIELEIKYGNKRRIISVFLHMPNDLRSVSLFGLSRPPLAQEKEQSVSEQFSKLIGGTLHRSLDDYIETIYRAQFKMWMTIPNAGPEYSNAIADESIVELKQAITLRPERWEAHFALANEYYIMGYFVTGEADAPTCRAQGSTRVGDRMFPVCRLDPEKALEEFKAVVSLEAPPQVLVESYYRIVSILEGSDRKTEAKKWAEQGAKVPAVRTLAASGNSFARSIIERAK